MILYLFISNLLIFLHVKYSLLILWFDSTLNIFTINPSYVLKYFFTDTTVKKLLFLIVKKFLFFKLLFLINGLILFISSNSSTLEKYSILFVFKKFSKISIFLNF